MTDLSPMVATARSVDLSTPVGAPSEDGDLTAEGVGSQLGSMSEIEPCRITLTAKAFDALQRRLANAGGYDLKVAKVLATPAPWDESCDKTSTPENQ